MDGHAEVPGKNASLHDATTSLCMDPTDKRLITNDWSHNHQAHNGLVFTESPVNISSTGGSNHQVI